MDVIARTLISPLVQSSYRGNAPDTSSATSAALSF